MKILFAHDGTSSSNEAFRWIEDFMEQFTDTEVVIIHVTPRLETECGFLVQEEELQMKPPLAQELEQITKGFAEDHLQNEIRFEHYFGSPIDVVCRVARLKQVDIVVLGARPRSSWFARFSRSVSKGVARRARKPVLIIRDDGKQKQVLRPAKQVTA